jgi:hypothetical protein
VALDPAVAVVDVERVLGEPVGQGSPDRRDALAGNHDGGLGPRKLLAGDTGHDVAHRRAAPGNERPDEIQQTAFGLPPHRRGQIIPLDSGYEIEDNICAFGPASVHAKNISGFKGSKVNLMLNDMEI